MPHRLHQLGDLMPQPGLGAGTGKGDSGWTSLLWAPCVDHWTLEVTGAESQRRVDSVPPFIHATIGRVPGWGGYDPCMLRNCGEQHQRRCCIDSLKLAVEASYMCETFVSLISAVIQRNLQSSTGQRHD